jgi:hypothetical protein
MAKITVPVESGNGAQPGYPDPMPRANQALPHVLTPEQVCSGNRPPGPRAVVYDTDGYYAAAGMAELLACDGFEVSVVTTFDVLSPVSDETLEGDMVRAHLHRAGVKVWSHLKHGGRAGGRPRPGSGPGAGCADRRVFASMTRPGSSRCIAAVHTRVTGSPRRIAPPAITSA